MRKFVACLLLLAPLLLRAVPIASADEEWCSDDPPRTLTTPHGNTIVVYETLGAPSATYVVDLTTALANTSYTARNYGSDQEGNAGTIFTLAVPVSDDAVLGSFAVQGIVSSGLLGSGTVYATTTGTSGSTLTLTFRYPAP